MHLRAGQRTAHVRFAAVDPMGIPKGSHRYPEGYSEGIPGLAGVAAAKVTAANALYRHEKGKFFVVENPARSHFWPS